MCYRWKALHSVASWIHHRKYSSSTVKRQIFIRTERVFRCFSSVLFFKSMRAGGKKKIRSARKNTIFEQAIPDPDNHERAHIVPAVDLLVTHYTFSLQWGKTVIIHVTARARHLPLPISVYGINRRAWASDFHFSQKSQCGAGPIAMYVCLFFSQMRKINAGGNGEISKKHAQA